MIEYALDSNYFEGDEEISPLVSHVLTALKKVVPGKDEALPLYLTKSCISSRYTLILILSFTSKETKVEISVTLPVDDINKISKLSHILINGDPYPLNKAERYALISGLEQELSRLIEADRARAMEERRGRRQLISDSVLRI